MALKYKKGVALAGALVICTALTLSGTMAFVDFSQTATNRFYNYVEPDATLHDDFDGTNKDVYVENSGTSNLFIRVRLNEYMQIGNTNFKGENITDVGAVTSRTKDKWAPHLYQSTDSNTDLMGDCGNSASMLMHSYFKLDMSGSQIKYKQGTPGLTSSDLDGPNKTVDPNGAADTMITSNPHKPILMSHYIAVSEKVKTTGVDSLTQFEKKDYEAYTEGCWLLDDTADEANGGGWAYWSVRLAPNTATNLLLDSVTTIKRPDETWYYAIDVKLQAVSVGDTAKWNADDNKTSNAADKLISDWKAS